MNEFVLKERYRHALISISIVSSFKDAFNYYWLLKYPLICYMFSILFKRVTVGPFDFKKTDFKVISNALVANNARPQVWALNLLCGENVCDTYLHSYAMKVQSIPDLV